MCSKRLSHVAIIISLESSGHEEQSNASFGKTNDEACFEIVDFSRNATHEKGLEIGSGYLLRCNANVNKSLSGQIHHMEENNFLALGKQKARMRNPLKMLGFVIYEQYLGVCL